MTAQYQNTTTNFNENSDLASKLPIQMDQVLGYSSFATYHNNRISLQRCPCGNFLWSIFAYLTITCFLFAVFGTNLAKRNLGDNFDERVSLNHNSFCVTADNQLIIATAFWDKSFRLYSVDSGYN